MEVMAVAEVLKLSDAMPQYNSFSVQALIVSRHLFKQRVLKSMWGGGSLATAEFAIGPRRNIVESGPPPSSSLRCTLAHCFDGWHCCR